MEGKGEAERSSGKVSGAAASKKSSRMKKKINCRYCNKKFNNHQALGGHQNAHKAERAAAHKEKVLGMASAYAQNPYVTASFLDSNKSSSPFHGKTLGVSASSITRFKPQPQSHIGLRHERLAHYSSSDHYTLDYDYVQATIHKLETLVAEGNFWQPSNSSMISHNGGIIKMPDLNVKPSISIDDENFGEENRFCPIPSNGLVEELDLTLKI